MSDPDQNAGASDRAFLRHPLTIAVISFVMTGLIGAGFTWWLDSLSKTREIESAERLQQTQLDTAAHLRAVDAVRELTDLIYERRTRAVLVASSIVRGASTAEIVARKTAYDEVYVRWNTRLPSLALRIREEIFKQPNRTEYEGYLNALTHQMSLGEKIAELDKPGKPRGYLTVMDACITDAFDAYQHEKRDAALSILKTCDFDGMNLKFDKCSELMVEGLYGFVNAKPGARKPSIEAAAIKSACEPQLRNL
jgi:hypothetical protein